MFSRPARVKRRPGNRARPQPVSDRLSRHLLDLHQFPGRAGRLL